jgi:hypothetical protein
MCSPNANRTNHLVVNKEHFVVEGGPRARRLQDDKSSRKKEKKSSDWAVRESLCMQKGVVAQGHCGLMFSRVR